MDDDKTLELCKFKLYEIIGRLQGMNFYDSDIELAKLYLSHAINLIDRTKDE